MLTSWSLATTDHQGQGQLSGWRPRLQLNAKVKDTSLEAEVKAIILYNFISPHRAA